MKNHRDKLERHVDEACQMCTRCLEALDCIERTELPQLSKITTKLTKEKYEQCSHIFNPLDELFNPIIDCIDIVSHSSDLAIYCEDIFWNEQAKSLNAIFWLFDRSRELYNNPWRCCYDYISDLFEVQDQANISIDWYMIPNFETEYEVFYKSLSHIKPNVPDFYAVFKRILTNLVNICEEDKAKVIQKRIDNDTRSLPSRFVTLSEFLLEECAGVRDPSRTKNNIRTALSRNPEKIPHFLYIQK